jgi:hypothetical protein
MDKSLLAIGIPNVLNFQPAKFKQPGFSDPDLLVPFISKLISILVFRLLYHAK